MHSKRNRPNRLKTDEVMVIPKTWVPGYPVGTLRGKNIQKPLPKPPLTGFSFSYHPNLNFAEFEDVTEFQFPANPKKNHLKTKKVPGYPVGNKRVKNLQHGQTNNMLPYEKRAATNRSNRLSFSTNQQPVRL